MERIIFTGALLLAIICNWICLINCETSEGSGEVEVGNPRSCEMKEDTNILEVRKPNLNSLGFQNIFKSICSGGRPRLLIITTAILVFRI